MSASDHMAYRFPVSIKGVIVHHGRIVLLKNERQEWELPGGKLEPDEVPEICLAREIAEELSLQATIADILDSWVYRINPEVDVVIVTYGCRVADLRGMALSHEHKELATFAAHEIDGLNMPAGYKASIRRWLARLDAETSPE